MDKHGTMMSTTTDEKKMAKTQRMKKMTKTQRTQRTQSDSTDKNMEQTVYCTTRTHLV
jgi:hypothetical protein